jgi:ribosomal protein L37AE/L43A
MSNPTPEQRAREIVYYLHPDDFKKCKNISEFFDFVFDQVQIFYGDVQKKETWEQFTQRIKSAMLEFATPEKGMESHKEKIKCPNCNSVEDAIVEHTIPFATFVHTCSQCDYIIMESEWQKATDEEIAFHNYIEAKQKLGTLGWNTFINSKEVEEYREWLRNDKYKHRIEWFEKEYPDGLYYFDKELNDYVGIRIMTKKFLAEADAAYIDFSTPSDKTKP